MDQLFWLYLLYGFAGFCLEVVYARLTHSSKQDRKCHLFLPVCPVYAVGALGVAACAPLAGESRLLLFILGTLVCTAAEWVLSLFYERVAGVAFWDYSHLPLNIDGRVCLPFSLCWGVLSLPLVYWLHPRLAALVSNIPGSLTLPAALFYLFDAVLSLYLLRRGGTDALRWRLPRVIRPSSAH